MPVISSEMLIYRLLGLNFMLVLRQLTDLLETAMASYLPFFIKYLFKAFEKPPLVNFPLITHTYLY